MTENDTSCNKNVVEDLIIQSLVDNSTFQSASVYSIVVILLNAFTVLFALDYITLVLVTNAICLLYCK